MIEINAELEPMPTEEALEFANTVKINGVLYNVMSYEVDNGILNCEGPEMGDECEFNVNDLKTYDYTVYTMAVVPVDNEHYNG